MELIGFTVNFVFLLLKCQRLFFESRASENVDKIKLLENLARWNFRVKRKNLIIVSGY